MLFEASHQNASMQVRRLSMEAIATESIIIILLVILNGLLAMSEIAIVSARKARLQQRADQGNGGAKVAIELANDPNQFLSTVQIGITLVGILAGAFGGATLAEQLAVHIQGVPALAPYSEAISVGVAVLVITYLSLVIGELVPKRLGLSRAESIASSVAKPMRWLSIIASPAVRLLSISTDVILRLFGNKPTGEPPVTEEEIRMLIRQGTAAGVFEQAEENLVGNVFRFANRKVRSLMTPRHEIVSLDIEDPPEVHLWVIAQSPHSRFLVCQGSIDDVMGIVRAKDMLSTCLAGTQMDLKSVLRRPLFVPENVPALKVLEMFKQSGTHMAIVLDEHGGTEGLVTHHDIMEALVGNIPSSGIPEESMAIQREDGSWLIDGSLSIDEFKQLLGLAKLPNEQDVDYETLAGLILTHIGKIPVPGDRFDWIGLHFEILDMDRHRIDKVLVKRKP